MSASLSHDRLISNPANKPGKAAAEDGTCTHMGVPEEAPSSSQAVRQKCGGGVN